jgi:hypothetical protein
LRRWRRGRSRLGATGCFLFLARRFCARLLASILFTRRLLALRLAVFRRWRFLLGRRRRGRGATERSRGVLRQHRRSGCDQPESEGDAEDAFHFGRRVKTRVRGIVVFRFPRSI